ncbi:MAG: histidinol phosphate phosphatase domain-containing protein [Nitrospirae bacterium]|nr:histidinol phosphate phosphatase domain-containing protein [Nitrospirota bacterium]
MIDLHSHTIFSDGELIPSELARRALFMGYRAIAFTDHVDSSNLEFVLPNIIRVARDLNGRSPLSVIPGVEITHVPPAMIGDLVSEARRLGARLVLVHGETIVEPVAEGTNRAAIEAGVDILTHPGLISLEDLLLAKEKGVTLEITARKGHSLSNGYIAKESKRLGIPVTINTDTHGPGDLVTRAMAEKILLAAGIAHEDVDDVFKHGENLAAKALK